MRNVIQCNVLFRLSIQHAIFLKQSWPGFSKVIHGLQDFGKRFLKQSEIRLQKSDMFLKTSDIPSGKLLHKLHNELERSTIFSWENSLFRLGHGFKLSYFFVAKSKDLQILATKIHQECRRTGSFAPRMHGLPLDFHWLWIVFNSRNAWYSASISWFWTWRSLNFHDFESFSQHFTCFPEKTEICPLVSPGQVGFELDLGSFQWFSAEKTWYLDGMSWFWTGFSLNFAGFELFLKHLNSTKIQRDTLNIAATQLAFLHVRSLGAEHPWRKSQKHQCNV